MKVTFLGTGTSHGVPPIDCMINDYAACPKGVCREAAVDQRHVRTRCSVLVQHDSAVILIDVSADFRIQALQQAIKRIDAVLVTHSHADHIMGIPDIRSYCRESEHPLALFGSDETVSRIRRTFSYIFSAETCKGGGIPHLSLHTITAPFSLLGLPITPLIVDHGTLAGCFGYRIGSVVYIPDFKSIPATTLDLMKGCEYLILDCLRDSRPHPTHAILPESKEIVRYLRPKHCYFTHLAHDIHYKIDSVTLDATMSFAFDGLSFTIE